MSRSVETVEDLPGKRKPGSCKLMGRLSSGSLANICSLVAATAAFGLLYCLVLFVFDESLRLSAEVDLPSYWGGPETLLFVNSLLMGWVSSWLFEKLTGLTGMVLLLAEALGHAGAVLVGFGMAAMLVNELPGFWIGLGVLCIFSATATAAFREYVVE